MVHTGNTDSLHTGGLLFVAGVWTVIDQVRFFWISAYHCSWWTWHSCWWQFKSIWTEVWWWLWMCALLLLCSCITSFLHLLCGCWWRQSTCTSSSSQCLPLQKPSLCARECLLLGVCIWYWYIARRTTTSLVFKTKNSDLQTGSMFTLRSRDGKAPTHLGLLETTTLIHWTISPDDANIQFLVLLCSL